MKTNIHDIRIRERICKGKEVFPNPDWKKRTLDHAMIIIGGLGPLMNIPQIVKIFTEQDAGGLSFITFVMFSLSAFPWLLYGFWHRDKVIVLSYFLWLLTDLAIVAGIVMYGTNLI